MYLPYQESSIKDVCVSCYKPIEGDRVRRYEQRGNWCERCSSTAYRNYLKDVATANNPLKKTEVPERFIPIIESLST